MRDLSRARLIVIPLLLGACHTWHTVPLSPNASGPLPRHSMVVLIGGERVEVEDGRTTRDSLLGNQLNGMPFAVSRDRVAFVEERRLSAGRSIAAGAGGMVAAFSLLVLVAFASLLGSWN